MTKKIKDRFELTKDQEKWLSKFKTERMKLLAYLGRYRMKEIQKFAIAVLIIICITLIIILKAEDIKQLPFIKKIFATEKKSETKK